MEFVVLCSPMRERCFVFLRNLIACKIQYPQRKLGICIIFESLQGVGKNVFWDAVGRILGSEQYMCTSKAEDVLGKHAEAIGKLLIVMNECEVGSKKEYEGLLKSRITETKLRVNPKHARPYDVEDFSMIVALTNKSNPLPVDISSMDRRFISWECGLTYRKKSSKWWGKFVDYLNQPETIAALYEYFNNIDISGYDFKAERKKVLTKSYQRLATVNIPCEAMILAELCKMYAQGRSVGESTLGVKPLPESNSEAYRICENDTSLTVEEVKAFFEENGVNRWCEPVDCYLKSQRGRQFNTVEEAKSKLMEGWVCHIMRSDVEIKKSEVYKFYSSKMNDWNCAYERSARKFYPKVQELKLPISEKQIKGIEHYCFNLHKVYLEMIERGLVDRNFALPGYEETVVSEDDDEFNANDF